MSKTVVLVCGTNRVGKTTLVDTLLGLAGEPRAADGGIVECGRMAGLHADKTHTSTKRLAPVISRLFEEHDIVFVEGMYLGTSGVIPLTLLHLAEKQLVVFLYAKVSELAARKRKRPKAYGDFSAIINKQRQVCRAVNRFAEAGIPVISFETGGGNAERIAEQVMGSLCC
ncbi:MAG: hypothetical protein LUI09_03690 [Prevotellaceae bacterium]|nr:hypothetical protein [Prevotellaceae bacterium]